MAMAQTSAVITYHKPGTRPPLYVAGTFSTPSWEPYKMEPTAREDGDYDFKKEVRGAPGSEIQYKFRIGDGDWWVLQDDHPTTTDGSGNTNNVLVLNAEESKEPQNGGTSATQRLQPPLAAATERSVTPIFARIAAEVADSAALLNEDVPPSEVAPANGTEQVPSSTSEVADTAEAPEATNTIDLQVCAPRALLSNAWPYRTWLTYNPEHNTRPRAASGRGPSRQGRASRLRFPRRRGLHRRPVPPLCSRMPWALLRVR